MDLKELKIAKTFRLTKKLGSGAFGEIFHAINIKNNMEVAFKLGNIFNKRASKYKKSSIIFRSQTLQISFTR
jgi:casein kinase 1/casein kinase 1 epsilon